MKRFGTFFLFRSFIEHSTRYNYQETNTHSMPLKKLNKTGIENEQNDDGVILRDTDEATIVKAAAVYKSI